ncbi:MAG TPA: hypothetical protein P5534_03900, partial [Candidatus Paceibacterota bacterium]|nr:hypothetical protein [Candidatus Paceibacterota bacterium]
FELFLPAPSKKRASCRASGEDECKRRRNQGSEGDRQGKPCQSVFVGEEFGVTKARPLGCNPLADDGGDALVFHEHQDDLSRSTMARAC